MEKKKMRRSTQELYGVDPEDFWDLPYGVALERKRDLAKRRLREVSDEMDGIFGKREFSERFLELSFLQKDIYDAISFNERLLEERKWMKKKAGRGKISGAISDCS